VLVLKKWKAHTVFGVLVVLNIVRNFHSYILFPALRFIIEDFDITYGLVGSLLGAYILLSAFAELLWSFLSDIKGIGRRILIFVGVLFSGIFSLLCYYSVSFVVFSLFYLLGGVSLAVIIPFSITIISDVYRSDERTQKLMLLEILGGIGLALGFGVSLAANAYLSSWKESMLILALVGLLVSFFILLVPEPPHGLSEDEIKDVVARYGYPFSLRKEDFYLIVNTPSNKYIVMQGLFGTIANGSLQLWLVQYLVVEAGFSETAASIFLAMGSIGALGGILIAKLADMAYVRNPNYKPLIAAICSAIEGFFFILFFLVPIRVDIRTQDFVEASLEIFARSLRSMPILIGVTFFFLAMIFNSPVGSIRDSAITDVNLPEFRATVRSGADILETFTKGAGIVVVGFMIDALGNMRVILIMVMLFWFLSAYYWFKLTSTYSIDIKKMRKELLRRKKEIIEKKSM